MGLFFLADALVSVGLWNLQNASYIEVSMRMKVNPDQRKNKKENNPIKKQTGNKKKIKLPRVCPKCKRKPCFCGF